MVFCLSEAVVPDSRKRSASMERMPVVRFSSSGVSSGEAALRGAEGDGVAGHDDGVELHGLMMVLRASRTSAAEEKRAEGCFSRQRRMTDSSSTGSSGTISRREGGSANWMARMVWNSGASGRWKGWRPVASS